MISFFTHPLSNSDCLAVDTIGDGPITVFVHGLGEGRYHWRHLLADSHLEGRRISYDLAGHGDSSWAQDGCYSVDKHADHLIALLKSLPAAPTIVVGHSMGGEIALRAAARGINNLCGVVLVDCTFAVDASIARRLESELMTTRAGFADGAAMQQWLAVHRPLVSEALRHGIAEAALAPCPSGRLLLKRDPRTLQARMTELHAERQNWAAFDAIGCDLLILRGAASSFLSDADAKLMARRARSGTTITVPRAGHGIALENPAGFLRAVVPFLQARLWPLPAWMQVRE